MINQFISWIEKEQRNISICDSILLDREKRRVTIVIEVMGTQFNNRSDFIENIHKGDSIQILRDSDNFFDQCTLSVCDMQGNEMGTMWMNLADELSPLIDAGLAEITEAHVIEVEPLSQKGPDAQKATLQIEMIIQMNGEIAEVEMEHIAPIETQSEPIGQSEIYVESTIQQEMPQPEGKYEPVSQIAKHGETVVNNETISQVAKHGETVVNNEPVSQIAKHDETVVNNEPASRSEFRSEVTGETATTVEPEMLSWKKPVEEKKEEFSWNQSKAVDTYKQAKPRESKLWAVVLVGGILIWAALLGSGYYHVTTVYIPKKHYEKADELYHQEKYDLAADEYFRAGDYRNAREMLNKCHEMIISE